jgi:hypothetical protein
LSHVVNEIRLQVGEILLTGLPRLRVDGDIAEGVLTFHYFAPLLDHTSMVRKSVFESRNPALPSPRVGLAQDFLVLGGIKAERTDA